MNGSSSRPANNMGARPQHHSRQSSVGSSLHNETSSYVQQLRMAKATVWSERGPKDAVSDSRKGTSNSQRKGRFGMKMFNSSSHAGPQVAQSSKSSKSKLTLYAAPQHTILVPRLSASEANEGDDFTNFTSSTYINDKRASTAPSLARSSLYHSHSQSRNNSLQNTTITNDLSESVPTSPIRGSRRAEFSIPSGASSSIDADAALTASSKRTLSQHQFLTPTLNASPSRSGSPTQLQHYSTNRLSTDSEGSDVEREAPRPKLFVANADISDSD